MKTFNNYAIGIAVLLALGACSAENRHAGSLADIDVIPVRLQPLAVSDTVNTITATGTFTTDDETALAFKNGGIIQQIRVREGDSFRKGQQLAMVESTEINATLRQAQLGLDKADRDYRRARQLYIDSVATLEQMENAKTALDAAKQDVERASYNVSHTTINAPFDGYVLQRPVNAGQVVGPGTPVLIVASRGRNGWLLKAGLSDRQWSAVRVGEAAVVHTDAATGKHLSAEVIRKSEGIDPQSGTFTVYLKMLDVQGVPLASGLFGSATIQLEEKAAAWFVPYEALLDGDGGKAYVFVTDDGKTARRVEVEVADITAEHAVVIAGLEGAKSLIVSGSPYLRDGSTITVK